MFMFPNTKHRTVSKFCRESVRKFVESNPYILFVVTVNSSMAIAGNNTKTSATYFKDPLRIRIVGEMCYFSTLTIHFHFIYVWYNS